MLWRFTVSTNRRLTMAWKRRVLASPPFSLWRKSASQMPDRHIVLALSWLPSGALVCSGQSLPKPPYDSCKSSPLGIPLRRVAPSQTSTKLLLLVLFPPYTHTWQPLSLLYGLLTVTTVLALVVRKTHLSSFNRDCSDIDCGGKNAPFP